MFNINTFIKCIFGILSCLLDSDSTSSVILNIKLKAEVGSLFLVSSGKNSIITFEHIRVVWKDARPWLALSANHGSFQRAWFSVGCSIPCCLTTGDVSASWLAVETSSVPYVIKLASGDFTSWFAGLSRAEMGHFTPLQPLREPKQKHGGEGAAELLP